MGRSFPGGSATDRIVPTGFNTHATERSYSAWFILDDVDSFRRIFEKVDGSNNDLENIWWHAAQNAFYYQRKWSGGLGAWKVTADQSALDDGQWHHILVTYDGSSAANDPIIYIDGSSVGITENQTPSGSILTSTDDWMIGNRASDLARCWDGDLAEIAIWDRILSSGEAAGLAGGDNPLAIDTDLVLYLPLLGDDSPEPDEGPGSFDGTVTGTTKSATHPTIDDPPVQNTIDLAHLDASATFHNMSVTVAGRVISFSGRDILVDGTLINPNSQAEGVPTNIRLVNATVDFSGEITWDADANTDALIAELSDYASYGLNAITINFQGGLPQPIGGITWATDGGYDAGAFNADGSLRPAHTARLAKLINAMLANDIIPIVGLFYFRQDDIFNNEQAIIDAVDNAAEFLLPWKDQILVEVANECDSSNYDFTILTDTDTTGVEVLIAQMQAYGFKVSTSFQGSTHPPPSTIVGGADYILLHGNDRTTAEMDSDTDAAIAAYPSVPIIYNEDGPTNRSYAAGELLDHYDEAIQDGIGWGIYLQAEYQTATSPTIDWTVRTGDSQDFFDQTLIFTSSPDPIDLDHADLSATFHVIDVSSGSQNLDLELQDLSATFHDTELVATVSLDHANLSAVFAQPQIDGAIVLADFQNTEFFPPTLGGLSVDLDLMDGSATFHDLSVGGEVVLDVLDASATFHTLTLASGSIDLDHMFRTVFRAVIVQEPGAPAILPGIRLPMKGMDR